MAEESKEITPIVETAAEEKKEEETIVSPLEEARKFSEENKKILEEIKKERVKLEKAAADIMVQGRSLAGQNTKPKEETPKEYAERIMRGGK